MFRCCCKPSASFWMSRWKAEHSGPAGAPPVSDSFPATSGCFAKCCTNASPCLTHWTGISRSNHKRNPKPIASTQAMNKTILVLDDDQEIRQSLRKLLQAEGFEVVLAAEGAEALNEFSRNKIDLL